MRKNIILDSQILNSIQACPLKTDLSFNKDLRPNITATPLEEGDLLHKMMESYYSQLKDCLDNSIVYDNEKFKSTLEQAISAGEAHYLTLSISPKEASDVIYQFKENITFHRLDGWKILEVEKAFIKELYKDNNLGIFLTGKIDVIVDIPNFGVSVVDHKSSKRNQDPDPLSNQFTLYSWATDLKKVMINRVGFQKTLTPEERFRRQPLYYTDEQTERWLLNTIWWCKFYYFCLENDSWPENRTSCDKFGGCIFSKVCQSATEEGRINRLKSDFTKSEKWDITRHLKKQQENDNSKTQSNNKENT